MKQAKRGTWRLLASVVLVFGTGVWTISAQTLSLTIATAPTEVVLPWGIDGGIPESMNITVAHSGPAVDYFLTVSAGNGGAFDPRLMDNGFTNWKRAEIPYSILTPAGEIAKDLTVTPLLSTNVITGTFDASGGTQTTTVAFTASLLGAELLNEDSYTDSVVVTLYQGDYSDPGNAVQQDSRTVTMSATIPQIYDIRLVATGAPPETYDGGFDMFLDDLTNGATGQADLLYRTNTAFSLEASSQNGGDLVSDAGDRIPYTITIAGSSYTLNNTKKITQSNSPTGSEYVREPLTVEVLAGDVTGMPPGYYQDIVTFDIIAK